jgi:hypothetical protein
MSRALAHRLTKPERKARACDLPTWAEVCAAMERLWTAACAHVAAELLEHIAPGRDEAQARTDRAMVDRWCREHGTYVDPKGDRARMQATLTTIVTRYAAAPPGVSLPRSTIVRV